MSKAALIRFDYDHDSFLRDAVVGQAKNPDSPFNLLDSAEKKGPFHNLACPKLL